jgi:acetyltransferase-like isoleucine patch superfamily enzyme
MRLTTSLIDSNVYVLHHSIMDLIVRKTDWDSLKHEVVPYLVRNQFKKTASYQPPADVFSLAFSMSSILDAEGINCLAFCPGPEDLQSIIPGVSIPTCARVVTVRSLFDISMHMTRLSTFINGKDYTDKFEKRLMIGHDCVVGRNFTFGHDPHTALFVANSTAPAQPVSSLPAGASAASSAHPLPSPRVSPSPSTTSSLGSSGASSSAKEPVASIKRCIIGNNVTIGRGCRLVNAVVMDNVSIADGVTINNSIIGKNVRIPHGVQVVKNSSIGTDFVFTGAPDRDYTNVALRQE